MVASTAYRELHEALFQRAALVEDFRPRDLLDQVVPAEFEKNILLRGQLISALREACTVSDDTWQMRPNPRRKILRDMTPESALPDTEISAALKGESIWSAENLQKMIANPAEIQTLSKAVATLELAGPAAPGHAHIMALSSKLDRLRREKATDDLLGDGFVGRDEEIASLLQALDSPKRAAPLRTLHIQGLPGIGKTFLLEELTRLCRARPRIVMIRLDFDRSSLRDGAPDAVFDEISRQIGTAIPEVASELHSLRLRSAERRTRIATQTTASLPFDLLHRMIDILAENDRQILFLLDTLEVLHGYGATFVTQLLQSIDRFADKERIDICVISAGRGTIFPKGDKRLFKLIHLEKLDNDVMEAILRKKNVPDDLRRRVIELSDGNPLRLILVARAIQDADGDSSLGDKQIRDAGIGYLYRAILSRVPSEIREIASDGLILPKLGSFELREIVGPVLGIPIDEERASGLLEMLEMQRWLVTRTLDGAVSHTDEVRREILELTYAESPENTRRINERAAKVLAGTNPALALYHRLQLSRNDGAIPPVDAESARQVTDDLLEDLPPEARDAVLRARGQRSRVDEAREEAATQVANWHRVAQSKAAAAPPFSVWLRANPKSAGARLMIVDYDGDAPDLDSGGLADLRNMLELNELREATHLLKQQLTQPFRLDGEAGLLALTHQWKSGHWSMARVLFDQLPDDMLEKTVEQDIGLTGHALLELWAEFRFDRLVTRLEGPVVMNAVQHALSLTQRSGLRDGALALAYLVAAGADKAREHGGIGVVARYFDDRQVQSERDPAERSNAMRAEYGLEFKPGQGDPNILRPAAFSQLLAPLNPYAEPVRALLEIFSEHQSKKVFRDVRAFGKTLTELRSIFAPEVKGVADAQDRASPRSGEVVELLNALGLTAEFCRGYSFFSPIPDLPTIALAAERWQQVTLGLWSYGQRRPVGWIETTIDPLVAERAERLLGAPDPVRGALRMLNIWYDPLTDASAAQSAILRTRLVRPYSAIAGLMTLNERITHLRKVGLASVLQAPVAALSQMGVNENEIFQAGSGPPIDL